LDKRLVTEQQEFWEAEEFWLYAGKQRYQNTGETFFFETETLPKG